MRCLGGAVILALLLDGASLTAPVPQTGRSAGQPTVVIVTTSAVEAFEDAVGGLRRTLGPAKVVTIDLASRPSDIAGQLNAKDVRLLITVGTNALESALQSSAV